MMGIYESIPPIPKLSKMILSPQIIDVIINNCNITPHVLQNETFELWKIIQFSRLPPDKHPLLHQRISVNRYSLNWLAEINWFAFRKLETYPEPDAINTRGI